jgi:hypothetical protein
MALKRSFLRTAAAICILAVGIGTLTWALSAASVGNRDFIEYWAAGHQLLHGSNPYDLEATMKMEVSAGYAEGNPLITPSPPVVLILALPIALVGPKAGCVLWTLMLIAALVASIRMLWIMQGRPDNRLHLFGYLFAPVLTCLMAGQIGIYFLFGMTLFLRFHRLRPFWAGAALLPCVLKPHLFLVFGVVLLVWIISRSAYRILAGFCAMMLACSAVLYCFDTHVWFEYLQRMSSSQLSVNQMLTLFIPTLSTVFRILINANAVWLQFVPAVAGCAWALWYFWTRRNRWNWFDEGMLVLLVSVMCAPYAWLTDEAVLLPAVLGAAYLAEVTGRSFTPFGVILGVALLEAIMKVEIISPFYLWTTPAWLAWYLYATGRVGGKRKIAESTAGVEQTQ